MNISVLTLFPQLYEPFLKASLIERAQKDAIVSFDVESLFSFCAPKERVDAPTFGHSAGMLIRPDVIERAVVDRQAKYGKAYKIFFSPHGKKLDQYQVARLAKIFAEQSHIMLLPARYEGMDVRTEQEYADEIVSIGDYVLMGGDLPAMVLLEAVLRLLPGVVGKQESIELESFSGPFVDHPEYTAPVMWQGHQVPEVLRSGNHKAIDDWRKEKAAERTVAHHFDWLRSYQLNDKQKKLAVKYIPSHYAVTMHSGVVLPGDKVSGAAKADIAEASAAKASATKVGTTRVGTTSVTSIDIHDIARSALTYGLKNYFVVTPLEDQQKIVTQLLDFWRKGPGVNYNAHRAESNKRVRLEKDFDGVIQAIKEKEGVSPLVIGTGARTNLHQEMISFHDQEKIWLFKKPVLFVFGTGHGLGPELLDRCDFVLEPIYGFTDFNHLSVRSAASIIFDRWLGINPKYLQKKL